MTVPNRPGSGTDRTDYRTLTDVVDYAATGGKRDFTSVKGLEAARYEVEVAASHYDEAMRAAGLR